MSRTDNFSTYQELRRKFPFFSYEDYHYHFTGKSLELSFSFNLSGSYFFNPRISIPYKKSIFLPFDSIPDLLLDNLVFHIGMIEMISYWKASCSPKVLLITHRLSPSQAEFWKRIYFRGLGEFFYVNSIPATMDDFMQITGGGEKEVTPVEMESLMGSIVPVGGGKDSAVTMGLMNRWGEGWLPMVINPGPVTENMIQTAGRAGEETIEIFRRIHPELLNLNAQGFLNGHTPFSALLAFYSLLAACLTGRQHIILSNESSANEPTVPGTDINHQYSKSFGFENDFRDYVSENISQAFDYFSLMRPLQELHIAKLFAGMPEFFPHFRSCNAGSKTASWCGKCPKCLFTYIILSPFVDHEKLSDIFGKDMLEDPELKDILDQLSGRREIKPFDCIGTVDEVNYSLDRALERYEGENLPFLLKYHEEKRLRVTSTGDFPATGLDWTGQHFVRGKFREILERAVK